ncbi:DNA gyrase subunit B [Catenulispora sp. GP43]|uniref:DNA gyrase subunit B n=1 Tax=Catenulispora sp. GP43 TaxID=3156263 RepID=UPI003512987B
MSQEPIKYDASHLQVLEGLEAVRKRPGMYVGSTGERGLHNVVFEAADRAIEEILTDRASHLEIAFMPDGSVRVADDGPGIPFEIDSDAGGPGLEAQLTRLMIGRSPGGPRYPVLSSFGLGLAVVNALSSRLVAEVQREGRRQVQEYARGVAVAPPADAGPAGSSGTIICFWPDPDIFETTECSFDVLAERFRELAFLNRVLDISLTDERRLSEPRSVRFRSPGGVREMVAFLDEQAAAPVHPEIISFERDDSQMTGTTEVALRWRSSGPEQVRSFANSRPTPGGGTHMLGFHDGVTAAVTAYARKRGLLTKADPDLSTDRISEGLTAIVSVKLEHPEFEGSTRDVLGNAAVRANIRQAVADHLDNWLEEHPQQAAAVLDLIIQKAPHN